jgi:hypothetical protein
MILRNCLRLDLDKRLFNQFRVQFHSHTPPFRAFRRF